MDLACISYPLLMGQGQKVSSKEREERKVCWFCCGNWIERGMHPQLAAGARAHAIGCCAMALWRHSVVLHDAPQCSMAPCDALHFHNTLSFWYSPSVLCCRDERTIAKVLMIFKCIPRSHLDRCPADCAVPSLGMSS